MRAIPTERRRAAAHSPARASRPRPPARRDDTMTRARCAIGGYHLVFAAYARAYRPVRRSRAADSRRNNYRKTNGPSQARVGPPGYRWALERLKRNRAVVNSTDLQLG